MQRPSLPSARSSFLSSCFSGMHLQSTRNSDQTTRMKFFGVVMGPTLEEGNSNLYTCRGMDQSSATRRYATLSNKRMVKFGYSFGLWLILCVGCSVEPPRPVPPVPMRESFFVHLQEGFVGERVQILVDGRQLYDGKPITKQQLGLADKFVGSAASSRISVTIRIPSRNINSTLQVDLTKARGLGISILNGEVSIFQANAFGYM